MNEHLMRALVDAGVIAGMSAEEFQRRWDAIEAEQGKFNMEKIIRSGRRRPALPLRSADQCRTVSTFSPAQVAYGLQARGIDALSAAALTGVSPSRRAEVLILANPASRRSGP